MVNILWNVKTAIYNVMIGENVKIMKILTYIHLFRLSKKHYIDKKIRLWKQYKRNMENNKFPS